MNVALRPRELGRVLYFDEDDEVEVVPHVVLRPDVLLKRHVFVVKRLKAKLEYCICCLITLPFFQDHK